METDRKSSTNGQPCEQDNDHTADNPYLTILLRYSAGEISARQAAALMGRGASEHDVYYELLQAGLPLPSPPQSVIDAQVQRAISLFGPSLLQRVAQLKAAL